MNFFRFDLKPQPVRMELVVQTLWMDDQLLFPNVSNEGSRQQRLAFLLYRAMPNCGDAMGCLLQFSKKNIAISGRHLGRRYPMHVFLFSFKGFEAILQYLAEVIGKDKEKPRHYNSQAMMQAVPAKSDQFEVKMVPPTPAAGAPATTPAAAAAVPPPTAEEVAEVKTQPEIVVTAAATV